MEDLQVIRMVNSNAESRELARRLNAISARRRRGVDTAAVVSVAFKLFASGTLALAAVEAVAILVWLCC